MRLQQDRVRSVLLALPVCDRRKALAACENGYVLRIRCRGKSRNCRALQLNRRNYLSLSLHRPWHNRCTLYLMSEVNDHEGESLSHTGHHQHDTGAWLIICMFRRPTLPGLPWLFLWRPWMVWIACLRHSTLSAVRTAITTLLCTQSWISPWMGA